MSRQEARGSFRRAFAIVSVAVIPDATILPRTTATCFPPYFFTLMVGTPNDLMAGTVPYKTEHDNRRQAPPDGFAGDY